MTDDATAALAAALNGCEPWASHGTEDTNLINAHFIIAALAAAGWAISEVHTWTLAAQRAGERAAVRAALEGLRAEVAAAHNPTGFFNRDVALAIIDARLAALDG